MRGVGCHALGGVHGDGVTVSYVFAQVRAFEEDRGAVIEAFSGQTVRRRVNCNDAPAVAVAHRPRTNGPTRAWCSPPNSAGRSIRGTSYA